MENKVKGKVIAITGASSGIGEAAATLLAGRGAKVVLGARRSEPLETLAARIRDAGGEAAHAPTDVKQRGDLERLIALACEQYGRLDVLVSNAGVMPISLLSNLHVEDWEEMVDVNIKGVLYGIAAALPVFRRQGFGHFVHIGSTAGHKTVPSQSVYSGTKFAVRAITDGLRQELGPENLRVSLISPGFTHTNFTDGVKDPAMKAQLEAARDKMAMPPEAVARTIAFVIEQPDDMDVGEIIVRPTAQG